MRAGNASGGPRARGPIARSALFFGPLAGLSLLIFAAACLAALLAAWLAPIDPLAIDPLNAYAAPNAANLLGTDALGRDILSRLIWGGRTGLLGPIAIVLLSGFIAIGIALPAAWHRGWVDVLISRVIDIMFAFPAILLALLAAATFGGGLWTAIAALSLASVPHKARLLRSALLRERSQPYIEALESQGMSAWRICLFHLVPAVWPLFATQLVLSFGHALVGLAAISFIGLGVQAPSPDWGLMVAQGRASILQGEFAEAISAGTVIIAVVSAVTFIGQRLSQRQDRRH
ncbi:ABC transporter permease [Mesorhizobium sp.]|uniref:ABC transporter permease n=1 Tax=Mesorhizobium sp. TaxID=1871066 RepID=UPI0025D479DA|nr:ABC transporter permease [Mesorhizobium sp.]